jgi:hypothetical protein
MVKLKMISFDHNFQMHKTPKNTKNILRPNKQSM